MTQHFVTQSGGTLLDKIVDFIIPPYIVLFLNQTLYRNSFFILNYWSFVHFFFGVIFYFLKPKKYTVIKWFVVLFIGHTIFEIIEYALAFSTNNPLFVEELIDIITDIIYSLIGFGLMYLIFRGRRWFK